MGKTKDYGKMVTDNWYDVDKLMKIRTSLRNMYAKDRTNGTANFTEENAKAFKDATLRIKELGKGEKLSIYPNGYIPPKNPDSNISFISPSKDDIIFSKEDIVVETKEEMEQKIKTMAKSYQKQLLNMEKKYQEKIDAMEQRQREELLAKYREWDTKMESQLSTNDNEWKEVMRKQRKEYSKLDNEWIERMEALEERYKEELSARDEMWLKEIDKLNKKLMAQKIKK